VGKPVPTGVSVSEHALNLVNADFVSVDEVEEMIAAWAKRAQPPPTAKTLPLPKGCVRARGTRLYLALAEKQLKVDFLDTGYLLAKTGMMACFSTLMCIFMVQARDREQTDVVSWLYTCFLAFASYGFSLIVCVLAYIARWPSWERDIKSGAYGPIDWWLVNSVGQVLTCTLAVPLTVLPWFVFIDWPWAAFGKIFVLMFPVALMFDTYANICSLFGRATGLALMAPFVQHNMFTCGIFTNIDEIVWPLRCFAYIFPGRLAMEGLFRLVLGEAHDFSGAIRVSDAPPTVLGTPAAQAALLAKQTFVCPDSPGVCYGDTGKAVMGTLSEQWSTVNPDVDYLANAGYLFVQAYVLRILGALAVWLVTRPPKARQVEAAAASCAPTESSSLLPSWRR